MQNSEEFSLDDMIKSLKASASTAEYKSSLKYGSRQVRREKLRAQEQAGLPQTLSSQGTNKTAITVDLSAEGGEGGNSRSQASVLENSQQSESSNSKKGFQKFSSLKEKLLVRPPDIFEGLTMFYIPDQNLTKKKLEIFQNQVEKHRGGFHPMSKYWVINEKKLDTSNIVITSFLTPFKTIEDSFCELGLHIKSFKCNILDGSWISECLKVGGLVDKGPYRVNLPLSSQPEAFFVASCFGVSASETSRNKPPADHSNDDGCEVVIPVSDEEPHLSDNEHHNKDVQDHRSQSLVYSRSPSQESLESANSAASDLAREEWAHKYVGLCLRVKKSKILISKEDRELVDFLYGIEQPSLSEAGSLMEIERPASSFDFEGQPTALSDGEREGAQSQLGRKALNSDEGKSPKHVENVPSGGEESGPGSPFREFRRYDPHKEQREQYWDKKKDHFLCVTGAKTNYNELITSELEKLLKVYTNQKDRGRMFAYKRAISTIRSLKTRIETVKDVENLNNIGDKIREKIKEILTTGVLRKAMILENDEKNRTIELFSGIWGVGPTKATQLFEKGFRTLEQLRANQTLLNDNQKVGLRHYEEFNIRVPRSEVAEIVQLVKHHVESLSDIKGVFDVICCGSYRRGKETCGDIDILLTRKDGKSVDGFLSKLVKSLESASFLTDHLAWKASCKIGPHDHETYMGVCRLGSNPHRRIDLKIYPREQFGFALLYFTGSDYFNRSMRLFARKKGYSLTDQGLFPVERVKGVKAWIGEAVPCYTEHEVFAALGLEYKSPEERNV